MTQLPVLQKPAFGQPCNRCGLCCIAEACVLGAAVFNQLDGPCPALETNGTDYSCGLVARPAHYAPAQTAARGEELLRDAARLITGQAMGCDCRDPDGPGNPAYDEFLSCARQKIAHVFHALIFLWVNNGGKEDPCESKSN